MKLSEDVGDVKGQLRTLPGVHNKLDSIGDVAKSAESSTNSAHKRLEEMKAAMTTMSHNAEAAAKDAVAALRIAQDNKYDQQKLEEEVEAAAKEAATALQRSGTAKEQTDKLDKRFWGMVVSVLLLAAKQMFDVFKGGGT